LLEKHRRTKADRGPAHGSLQDKRSRPRADEGFATRYASWGVAEHAVNLPAIGMSGNDQLMKDFDDLIAEAQDVDVFGWNFSWLDGRATEQRPSWGYQRLMSERLATATAALDIQTGGGEVLAGAERFPLTMVATESWPPNVALSAQRLHPRGVVVVADPDEPPLPFADDSFDLVTSRHPATVWWQEIARVLRPTGTYLAQHIGPRSLSELYEWFLGPQSKAQHKRDPERERADAEAAGLTIKTLRMERLRVEFFDVGAVVYFLRKVIWTVPDFSVERYLGPLGRLHEQILRDGAFVAHSSRVLIEAQVSE
jgi:SAM-dependent methyltransferase